MAAEESRQFALEVAERTRVEQGAIDLAARLMGALGAEVAVTLRGGRRARGTLVAVASQWLLLGSSTAQRLIPMPAVAAVAGLPRRAVPLTEIERRLSLGAALRALSRDRAHVIVRVEGADLPGLLGAVGADHVDLRLDDGGGEVTVPFAAILEVASAAH